MVWRNPNDIDVQDRDGRTFLGGTNEDDDDDSTYNKTDGEGSETGDTDDTPTVYNAGPGDVGVTATDLHNLQRNAGFHNGDTKDNKEDRESTASEWGESATPTENEN